MDKSSLSTVNKQLIQFYVHEDIVNWLRTILEKNCADIVTFYDQVYHYDFENCNCVLFYGDASKVHYAYEIMMKLMETAQYKMPWINDTTYYTRSEEQLLSIQAQLNETTKKYLIETHQVAVQWFGSNDLFIMKFVSECDDSEFKTQIEQKFKSLIVDKPDKPIFITDVIALHKATQPPCTMQTNVLTAFHGKILDYLSIEDVFALEIAIKDHRISHYDQTLDFDIQQNLRKRLPMLYSDEYAESFEIGIQKHHSVVCHYICKYHDRFTSINAPTILADYEAQLLSEMYNIQISHNSHICTHKLNEHGLSQLSVSLTMKNHQHRNNEASVRRNFNWLNDGSWNYFMKSYNANEEIELIIENGKECPKEKLCGLFVTIINTFKDHNRYKAIISLKEIDCKLVPPKMLMCIFSIFSIVQFQRVNFDVNVLLAVLDQFPPPSYAILRTCRITSTYVKISEKSVALMSLKLVDCDLELATLFTICERFSRKSEIILEECRYLSTIYAKLIANISVSRVKFIRMNFKCGVLFEILKRFRGHTTFNFNECVLFGSNEKFPNTTIQPSILEFLSTQFDQTAFLIILEKCARDTNVYLYKCFIPPLNESVRFNIQVSTVMFNDMSFETNNLLLILQQFSKHCTVYLTDCKILATEELLPRRLAIQVSTVLFTGIKFDILQLVTILDSFSAFANINFLNCKFLTTKPSYSGTSMKPLILKFKTTKFGADVLFRILEHVNRSSSVLLDECRITCTNGMGPGRNVVRLAVIQFTNINFEFDDLIRILEKFDKKSKARISNCTIKNADQIFSTICVKLTETVFEYMTFGTHTLLKLLERFEKTSQVYFSDCRITNLDTRNIYYHNISLQVSLVAFSDIEFSTNVFLSILAKFPQQAELNIVNCYFVAENRVIADNLLDLIVIFTGTTFQSQALLQIIPKFIKNSLVLFNNCEIEETINWNPTNISLQINCLEFYNNPKFSYSLIKVLQCIQSSDYIVRFDNCQLTNQNLIDICTRTPIFGDRVEILGDHQINESFFFELFLQYYHDELKNVSDIRGGDELEIPVHIIPHVSKIKNNFAWDNMRLVCVPVNDVTIKLEILQNGCVVDLFGELNGLTDEPDVFMIDYY